MNNPTFEFISDPGHGWLRVPMKLIENWNIDILISPYSYRTTKYAYLEEDCDASVFLDEAKKRGFQYEIKRKYIEDFESFILNKYSFNNNIRTA